MIDEIQLARFISAPYLQLKQICDTLKLFGNHNVTNYFKIRILGRVRIMMWKLKLLSVVVLLYTRAELI